MTPAQAVFATSLDPLGGIVQAIISDNRNRGLEDISFLYRVRHKPAFPCDNPPRLG